jgi:hypothetical protein
MRHERLARRGSPEDAVGEAEIVRKFTSNVDTILSEEAATNLRGLVMGLDRLDHTGDLTELLRVE